MARKQSGCSDRIITLCVFYSIGFSVFDVISRQNVAAAVKEKSWDRWAKPLWFFLLLMWKCMTSSRDRCSLGCGVCKLLCTTVDKKKTHCGNASCDIEESAVWFRRDASMREVASRVRSQFRSWIKHPDSLISQDSDFMHQQHLFFFFFFCYLSYIHRSLNQLVMHWMP